MNMRQRFGLALLIFWSGFITTPSEHEPLQQIAWVALFFFSVALFTFPRKDESQ